MPENEIPKPTEAINYVKRKLPVATGPWDQLQYGEHVHAFTVAHSTSAALIEDIFKLMKQSMEEGTGLGEFKKNMKKLMAQKGWYGRPDKTAKDKKYINWRLRTIYQTNILTAYSAGETKEMLKTAHLYPYWQYQQVQRASARESHSPFHNMILRYDDPFWATGTPPNGWGCQCYRNQLTESQAKTQGGPSKTPPSNIINSSISKEWRYDPGREMLAPNFRTYSNLASIKVGGKSALSIIKKQYADEIAAYQMSQAEWKLWRERTLSEQSNNHIPIHMATLKPEIADQLDIDSKLITTDKEFRHGARTRLRKDGRVSEKTFTVQEMDELPKRLSSPDSVYKDTQTGNLVMVYQLDEAQEAWVVFRVKDNSSPHLTTFYKNEQWVIKQNKRYQEIYAIKK